MMTKASHAVGASILPFSRKSAIPFESHTTLRDREARRWPMIQRKILQFAAALVVTVSLSCLAEEPALSVYEIRREDMNKGQFANVVMKVSNPTAGTYYILGLYMTDVPYVIEIERDGKWIELDRARSLSVPKMRSFLPASYLLFEIFPPFVDQESVTFRVRAFLYTDPTFTNPYRNLTKRPFIEIVSKPMSTKDLAPLDVPKTAIPGFEAIPAPK